MEFYCRQMAKNARRTAQLPVEQTEVSLNANESLDIQ